MLKPKVDINGSDIFAMHIQRPQNNGSDKIEINKVGRKYQDNNEFILNNDISDAR